MCIRILSLVKNIKCHAWAKNQNMFTFTIVENVVLADLVCTQHFIGKWICMKFKWMKVIEVLAKMFQGLDDFPFSQWEVGKIWKLSNRLHCFWGTDCFEVFQSLLILTYIKYMQIVIWYFLILVIFALKKIIQPQLISTICNSFILKLMISIYPIYDTTFSFRN